MRHPRSAALLVVLMLVATACSQRDWNRGRRNTGWDEDWNDRWRNVDDCQRGKGRVNMRKWQQRVDDFQTRPYKNKKNFQHDKQQLLSDLSNERAKACNWETRRVDDMMAQVRSQRW
jgi:hypothetical protein